MNPLGWFQNPPVRIFGLVLGLPLFSTMLCHAVLEYVIKKDLEDVGRYLVNAPIKVSSLELGFNQSRITSFSLPNTPMMDENTEKSQCPFALKSQHIHVRYPFSSLYSDRQRISQLVLKDTTIHWDGWIGKNWLSVLRSLQDGNPRKRRKQKSTTGVQIEELILENTTLSIHIRNHTTNMTIPYLKLQNLNGTTVEILQEVLSQLSLKIDKSSLPK